MGVTRGRLNRRALAVAVALAMAWQGFGIETASLGAQSPGAASEAAPFVAGVILVGLRQPGPAAPGRIAAEAAPAVDELARQWGVVTAGPLFPLGPTARVTSALGASAPAETVRVYRARLQATESVEAGVARLRQLPDVAYAEPDYVAHILATLGDPLYPDQWGLARVAAPAAWDLQTGLATVPIAIVPGGLRRPRDRGRRHGPGRCQGRHVELRPVGRSGGAWRGDHDDVPGRDVGRHVGHVDGRAVRGWRGRPRAEPSAGVVADVDAAIFVQGPSEPTVTGPILRRNRITQNLQMAIQVWASKATIEGNLIADNDGGVGLSAVVFRNNTVTNNRPSPACATVQDEKGAPRDVSAVVCVKSAEADVSGNNILRNRDDSKWSGGFAMAGMPSGSTFSAARNYWGTTNADDVAGMVFDQSDAFNQGFSIVVESDVPIIAERAMYFGSSPQWRGGHESAGVPAPSPRWSLPEGATGPYFDTYVLVANPNDEAVAVTFTFLLGGANTGTTYAKTVTVGPNARYTLNLEDLAITDGFARMADTAVSTSVEATRPIVVERAMYWPGGSATWTEAHNGFGVVATATTWGLSEGRVGGTHGFETFVLLANPDPTLDAQVRATLLRESGAPITQTMTVPAASRYNVWVNADVPGLAPGERFGVVIESLPVAGAPAGVPISVERAMYWDSGTEHWAGGTNAPATKLR
jgi:hypothetical protein